MKTFRIDLPHISDHLLVMNLLHSQVKYDIEPNHHLEELVYSRIKTNELTIQQLTEKVKNQQYGRSKLTAVTVHSIENGTFRNDKERERGLKSSRMYVNYRTMDNHVHDYTVRRMTICIIHRVQDYQI